MFDAWFCFVRLPREARPKRCQTVGEAKAMRSRSSLGPIPTLYARMPEVVRTSTDLNCYLRNAGDMGDFVTNNKQFIACDILEAYSIRDGKLTNDRAVDPPPTETPDQEDGVGWE